MSGQSSISDVQDLCGQLDRLEISLADFVYQCSRLINDAIGCSRSGIWLFDEVRGQPVLHCLGLYDQETGHMLQPPPETQDAVRPYFDALMSMGHVMAIDAQTHPATCGFFGNRLGSRGVRSLMAAAFSLNGKVFGAFTCTQLHRQAAWTQIQLSILKQMGSRVSLALGGVSRTVSLTMPMPL